MQILASCSWLPKISSLRRYSFFDFFEKLVILSLTFIITFFSPLILAPAYAQTAGTTFFLSGANTTSEAFGIIGGNTMAVDVNVKNVTDPAGLAAFAFKISYNPNLLSIPYSNSTHIPDPGSVTVGPFLGSLGKSVNCSSGYIGNDLADSTKKDLTFICTTLGSSPTAPRGSGVLAIINFKTGNTVAFPQLNFVKAQLANNTAKATLIPNTIGSTNLALVPCADFNNDHKVTVADILYVVSKFGTKDAAADLDKNGIVTVQDILIAVGEFGMTC